MTTLEETFMTTVAGALLVSGYAAHDPNAPLDSHLQGKRVVDRLLTVAAEHGYPRADILKTLFANRERSPRMFRMCVDAVRRVPATILTPIMIELAPKEDDHE